MKWFSSGDSLFRDWDFSVVWAFWSIESQPACPWSLTNQTAHSRRSVCAGPLKLRSRNKSGTVLMLSRRFTLSRYSDLRYSTYYYHYSISSSRTFRFQISKATTVPVPYFVLYWTIQKSPHWTTVRSSKLCPHSRDLSLMHGSLNLKCRFG